MDNHAEKMEEWVQKVSGSGWKWYVKRLSGNDTLANESHQAGPYIPKPVMFDLFPQMEHAAEINPRVEFKAQIDSCLLPEQSVRLIWYNNKSRNESRITGWGGKSSPVLDPDSTGSLCVFAFRLNSAGKVEICRAWLCTTIEEEYSLESLVGSVDPGKWLYGSREKFKALFESEKSADPCIMDSDTILQSWNGKFPTGAEIIRQVISAIPGVISENPDKRLMLRRDCEFTLFKSLENHFVLPQIKSGFSTIEEFTDFANSILNRRKSRSGKSLELQAREIFLEENLTDFVHDKCSEGKKRPDFIFPSDTAYQDENYPVEKLRILAAKTTCKDRWRQVTREADRVPVKHLLTLQEGVSLNQFEEMTDSGIKLVVPSSLKGKYNKKIRNELMTFDQFISNTKSLYEKEPTSFCLDNE